MKLFLKKTQPTKKHHHQNQTNLPPPNNVEQNNNLTVTVEVLVCLQLKYYTVGLVLEIN